MAANFRRNPSATSMLKASPQYVAMLHEHAVLHARAAESLMAGVGRGKKARTIHADADNVLFPFPGPLLEFGSVNNPAYAPLRRAAYLTGLKLIPNPK